LYVAFGEIYHIRGRRAGRKTGRGWVTIGLAVPLFNAPSGETMMNVCV